MDSRAIGPSDGTTLPLDGLIIATGVCPQLLPCPAEVDGLHVLGLIDDVLHLGDRLYPRRRLVGAGFLAAEIAAADAQLNVAATPIEPVSLPLAYTLGTEVGQAISDLDVQHGVTLITGVAVSEPVTRDRQVRGPCSLTAQRSRRARFWMPSVLFRTRSGLRAADSRGGTESCVTSTVRESMLPEMFRAGTTRCFAQVRIEHRAIAAGETVAVTGNLLGWRRRARIRVGALLRVRPLRRKDPGARISTRSRRGGCRRRSARGYASPPLTLRRPACRGGRDERLGQKLEQLAVGYRGRREVE